MNPLIPLLLQGGGTILSGLFGRGQDRAERRRRAEIRRLSSPEHMLGLQNQLYSQYQNSPAFAQARRGLFNANANMGNQLNASLASRGLSQSGIGAIAPTLAGSALAGQLGGLRTAGYNAAGQQAGSLIGNQISALTGMGAEPNYMGQAIGGGLGDLGQLIALLYGPKK